MRRILVSALVIFVGLIGAALGQSANDAFRGLKKIEAKAEMGITYPKYREALGDANVELKLFIESPAAKKAPELASSLKKAMGNYKDAADLWAITVEKDFAPFFSPNIQIGGAGLPGPPPNSFVISIEFTNSLFKKYPKAHDKLMLHRKSGKEISLNDFLSVIWADASKELKKSAEYLKAD